MAESPKWIVAHGGMRKFRVRRFTAVAVVIAVVASVVCSVALGGAAPLGKIVSPLISPTQTVLSAAPIRKGDLLPGKGETMFSRDGNLPDRYQGNGLQLFYDGYDNIGRGERSHSATTTVWVDLSGNGNNGVIENYASGMWQSNGLRLNSAVGLNQSVRLPVAFNNLLSDNRTVELVFCPREQGENAALQSILFSNGSAVNPDLVFLGLDVEGTGNSSLTFSLQQESLRNLAPKVASANAGVTVALSLNKATGTLKIYRNGQLTNTVNNPKFAATTFANATPFRIGSDSRVFEHATGQTSGSVAEQSSSFEQAFDGSVLAVRVYDRVLSDGEVAHNAAVDSHRFAAETMSSPGLSARTASGSAEVDGAAANADATAAPDTATGSAADEMSGLFSRLSVEVRSVFSGAENTEASQPLKAKATKPRLDAETQLRRYLPTSNPGVDL